MYKDQSGGFVWAFLDQKHKVVIKGWSDKRDSWKARYNCTWIVKSVQTPLRPWLGPVLFSWNFITFFFSLTGSNNSTQQLGKWSFLFRKVLRQVNGKLYRRRRKIQQTFCVRTLLPQGLYLYTWSMQAVERRVTSRYRGSKISGSQQSLLTAIYIAERWKKRTTVCWDTVILLPWQRDVTTSFYFFKGSVESHIL